MATDLSAQAGKAVQRAGQLGAQHNARVTALHVLPEGLNPELVEVARACLRAHLDQYSTATVAEAAVRHGNVARAVDAEAVEHRADLLVVGAHGTHRLAGAFLGSTPADLVRVSQAPVLVVREPPEDAYRTVALAVDTSCVSAMAARTACALTPRADHILVHVSVVIGEILMRMRGAGDEQLAQLRKVSTEEVRGHIMKLATELAPAATRVVIETGRPQTLLPQLCHRHAADLVAVGTGGHSRLGYALLGSVAQHVLRYAHSDVLVVPARKG
ncbi:nucleotide-binding universal stress UspA family protein [Amycolatopsis cihanbeyliensis]|uniref:Nucleotide-binding universal stress UspA family protein n=1 Tax=Amycolatopsis cihanbeyliensis TaxID=1128664 RepID=A0A542DQ22_AMYCI|nr:nucleotide-binding universal stress UspA family protein [Amycolatopsis cihanbeyliensis]